MAPAPALLITRDELLLEDLLRLAAAAGVALDVAHDTTSALRSWPGAAVVLIGADLVDPLAEKRPPRRDRVHVVGHGPLADGVFRCALLSGATDVVELPGADDWLVEMLTDVTDTVGGRRGRGATVGVMAGCGGAGATTVATALALVSSRRQTTTLVDLDPLGPGLDRVVGLDESTGVRWDGLVSSRGRLGSRSLRAALPGRDGLAVLTWGLGAPASLDAAAVREVVSAAQRGNDLVVVDLPRVLDEATTEVVTRCDRLLLVVEPSLVGVASAAKVVAALRPRTRRVGLVLRRVASALPVDQVSAALDAPVLAEVGHQRRLAEHVELGVGPVPTHRSGLARAARRVLAELATVDDLLEPA